MKLLTLLTILFILSACNSGEQKTLSEDTVSIDTIKPNDTLKDSSASISPQEAETPKNIKTFKGLYTSGNEVSTFRDCGTKKVYWLEDESKKLEKQYKKTTGYLSYPYESVYVEVKGYLKGKSDMGYASEYENVLVVVDVLNLKQKSHTNQCFDFEFLARGNEPFWALDIIPSENIIALKDVGSEKTFVFPYVAGKVVGNTIIYETSTSSKQRLKAIFTKEACSDGMSDMNYNYSAVVNIDGRIFKGCGIKKGDKIVIAQ